MMNTPKEIAESTINIGKAKTSNSILQLLILGFLAGMFIAFGAVGANTVSSTIENASLAKVAGAMVFPVGLAMVLIAGSELFTGNSLITVSVITGDVKLSSMLRNWLFVYIGNFAGSIFVAAMNCLANQFGLFSNAVAINTIGIANAKCGLSFTVAIASGVLCNILVCIAVWMSFGAKTVGGKISALYLPILTFVLAGFEHSVANMYYIPAGLLAKENATYLNAALEAGKSVDNLTWANFFAKNLLPVTIGNIIGGCLIAVFYWIIFIRKTK